MGKEHKQDLLDFIRNEKRRSNIMTMARIQPSLGKLGVFLAYYFGKEKWARNVTERNKTLSLHKNHFFLKWKSQGVSFNKAIEESNPNFKRGDKYITEENVNSHFEYIYTPKTFESHLTNFITYDLETHNTDGARLYVFCFYRISKLSGRYNCD